MDTGSMLRSPSSTRMATIAEVPLQNQPPVEQEKRRKKCHGNRKVQRFRKRYRARGMKPATIAKKINKKFGLSENQAITTKAHDNSVAQKKLTKLSPHVDNQVSETTLYDLLMNEYLC